MKLIPCIIVLFLSLVLAESCNSQLNRLGKASQKNESQMAVNDQKSEVKLNELEAVKRAQEFIVQNGYTNLPPTEDKAKLTYESLEGGSSPDEVLKYRRNTLENKAYGIIKGRRGESGWTVVFRYSSGNTKYRQVIPNYDLYIQEKGRAVTMDIDGGNIRIEHEDILLSTVEKKLASAHD